MRQFKNKVVVITGGASGIGYAIAEQAASRGMNIVIADIEETALQSAKQQLQQLGAQVLAVKTDVTVPQQMQALADKTLTEFDAVHLMVNNAGVGGVAGNFWETELSDWQWVINVNLWGVIHGIHVFSRIMVKQNEGHIVNTASVAGLMPASGMGAYTAAKHAVVAMSEALYGELQTAGHSVDVSVLCPSYISTNIGTSDRNRPDAVAKQQLTPEEAAKEEQLKAYSKKFFDEIGMAPSLVAEKVFDAVENRRFYILTHPGGTKEKVKNRMTSILNEENPPILSAGDFPA